LVLNDVQPLWNPGEMLDEKETLAFLLCLVLNYLPQ